MSDSARELLRRYSQARVGQVPEAVAELLERVDALGAVAEAARLIQAYDQAGGNEWWEAHAKLYLALAAVGDEPAKESPRNLTPETPKENA